MAINTDACAPPEPFERYVLVCEDDGKQDVRTAPSIETDRVDTFALRSDN